MNRIIATIGLAALGTLMLQSSAGQDMKVFERPKPEKEVGPDKLWSVVGAVRGFYDDNYTTLPSRSSTGRPTKRSSWGLDLRAGGVVLVERDQNSFGFLAGYNMKYFEDRRENSADHELAFLAAGEHRFTESHKLVFGAAAGVAQEPGVLDPGLVTSPLRTAGNNFSTSAGLRYEGRNLVGQWGLDAAYLVGLFDYEQTGTASRSALLDRVENYLMLAGRYRFFDETETDGLIGYTLGLTDQTSKDSLLGAAVISPSARDSRSHYIFAGIDHKFSPTLQTSLRLGVQYVEYPNASSADAALAAIPAPAFSRSQVSPYVDGSVTWEYLPKSSLQVGARHARATTDIQTSLDSESSVLYSSLEHEFTPDLTGGLNLQVQRSQFRQSVGQRDAADLTFTSGLRIEWRFHEYIWLQGGYAYDRLDSDLQDRSYYRNRIFLGFFGAF